MYRLVHRHHHLFIRLVEDKEDGSDVELPSGLGPVLKIQLLIEILQLSLACLFSGLGDLGDAQGTLRAHKSPSENTTLLCQSRPTTS